MTNEQAQLVASELREMGFSAAIKIEDAYNDRFSVIVALRRWLNISEVEMALEQVFDEIEFKLSRIDSQKVRVD